MKRLLLLSIPVVIVVSGCGIYQNSQTQDSENTQILQEFENLCKNTSEGPITCPDPTRMENCKKNRNTITYTKYSPSINHRCMSDAHFTGWNMYEYSCEGKKITKIFDGAKDTKNLRKENKHALTHMNCGADFVDRNDDYLLISGHPYEGPYCGARENYFLFERNTGSLRPLSILGYSVGQGTDKPELKFSGFDNGQKIQNKIDTIGENYISETFGCASYTITIESVDLDSGEAEFSAIFTSNTGENKIPFSGNIYQRTLNS